MKPSIWFWIQFFKEILISVPILKIRPCFDLILTNPNWNQWLVHFELRSSQSPFIVSFLFKNVFKKNLISVSRANGTENLAQSLQFRKKKEKKENQVLIPILIPKIGWIYGSVLPNQNWNQQFLPPKLDTCFTQFYTYSFKVIH